MKNLALLSFLLLALVSSLGAERYPDFIEFNEDQERYISKFKEVAMREMERSGIPASIKLAQGILESGSGTSYLARNAKNHFGIKCGTNWQGDKVYREDDDYNDRGQLVKSCFREYRNAEASFVAHSEFLRDPKKSFRYGFLFRLNPTDYVGWANGLRQAGYATNPRYPELLITLIERYNLSQYDMPGGTDPIIPGTEPVIDEVVSGIHAVNDVSYFISEAPVTVEEVARKVDLSVSKLLEYNEELQSGRSSVTTGERVFFQKKRRSYRGKEVYYTIQAGEDLYDVSQRFGLRMKQLARRNRLPENADPATGEKIKLRGSKADEAPRLEGDEDPNAPKPGAPIVPTNPDGSIDLDTDSDTDPGPIVRPGPVVRPPVTPTPNPPITINPPYPGTTVTPPPTTTPVPTQPVGGGLHSVTKGETLYGISRQYGLTVDQLMRLNNLGSTNISVGQQLRVK